MATTRLRRKSYIQNDAESAPPVLPKESEFSFTLTRVAVAQICRSTGFKAAEQPALEALTDVATRYLQAIASLAAASANSDGRTDSNLPDIIVALEDLASVQGFPGLSSVRSPPPSLYESAVLKGLIRFVEYTDEIPFAQPLPRWRRNHHPSKGGKFLRCCDYDCGNRSHVPRWLPAVPEMGDDEEGAEREVKWGCLRDERKQEGNALPNSNGSIELSSSELPDSNDTIELSSSSELPDSYGTIELSSSELSSKRGKLRFKIGVGGQGSGWRKSIVENDFGD